MLADARRREFDVLMVWRFDRLSRSVQHFVNVVGELRDSGVDLVSHEQSFDTTTAMSRRMGRAVRTIRRAHQALESSSYPAAKPLEGNVT
jgi:DNA invertase Pin-like site-specific DNA recombinase